MEKYKAREFSYTKLVAVVNKEMAIECLKAIGKGDDILTIHPYCNHGIPFVAHLIFWGDGYARLDFAYRDCAGLFPVINGEINYQENYIYEYKYSNGDNVLVEQICFQTFLGILKTIDRTKIKVR